MIARLMNSGFLTATSQDAHTWLLGNRNALVQASPASAVVAVALTAPLDTNPDWATQASLMLASCQEAQDCALQLQDKTWLLWCFFDDNQDDDELAHAIAMQLAIAQYLEQGLMNTPTKQNVADFIGRTA